MLSFFGLKTAGITFPPFYTFSKLFSVSSNDNYLVVASDWHILSVLMGLESSPLPGIQQALDKYSQCESILEQHSASGSAQFVFLGHTCYLVTFSYYSYHIEKSYFHHELSLWLMKKCNKLITITLKCEPKYWFSSRCIVSINEKFGIPWQNFKL